MSVGNLVFIPVPWCIYLVSWYKESTWKVPSTEKICFLQKQFLQIQFQLFNVCYCFLQVCYVGSRCPCFWGWLAHWVTILKVAGPCFAGCFHHQKHHQGQPHFLSAAHPPQRNPWPSFDQSFLARYHLVCLLPMPSSQRLLITWICSSVSHVRLVTFHQVAMRA